MIGDSGPLRINRHQLLLNKWFTHKMVDQQGDETVKGHSFLIENILSRDEKSPKTADRPTQITMAHITGQSEHSPRITDLKGIP